MIFPVKVPYTVGPDIVKYQGAAFNANPDPGYLQEKKKELELHGSNICGTISNDYLHHLNAFCGFDINTSLLQICTQLEEDVAILKDGHLHTIGFCPINFGVLNETDCSLVELASTGFTIPATNPNKPIFKNFLRFCSIVLIVS